MTEQIYINGVLMDMKSGSPISLVFQSMFFSDIDSIVSNRTNSASFPATKNNLSAIDGMNLSGSGSKFAYRRHKVLYFRDGIQIFSGYGTLLSITPTELKFSFTWGNVSMFQKLLNYNIRDLRTLVLNQDILIPWNDEEAKTSEYYATNLKTGGHPHPVMKLPVLIDFIERACGVTFDNKDVFDNYRIPVLGIQADDDAKRLQGVIMGSGTTVREIRQLQYWHYLAIGLNDRDVRGLYTKNGIFNVEDFDKLKIIFSHDFQYSVPAYTGMAEQSIRIFACSDDGKYMQQLYSIPLTKTGKSRFTYSLGIGIITEPKEVILDVSAYTHIRIMVYCVGTAQSSATPFFATGSTTIIPDYDKDQELIYGGYYPLLRNMPDWTVSQLLKNLMKMEGLFAACVDDKTIRFVSVDELYKNRGKALDITDAIVLENNAPAEKTFTFGSFAKTNYFKYADDDTVSVNANGQITIDDDNLDNSTDVITLDFAASDEKNGVVSIPIYKTSDDGELEYEEVTPRILKVTASSSSANQETLTFQGLDWPSLIASKYDKFSNIIQNAKVIKASILMNSVDLSHLNLTVPMYSYGLGHYYAIYKMTTKSDGMADVELLQMGEDVKDEYIDVGDMNLAVVPAVGGGYCATLTNRSIAEINSIRADKNYKVCLIRYGYARRGKFIKYKDRTGKETNSKTSRNAQYNAKTNALGYKSVRKQEGGGTPCWRIIGHDLLYVGRIAHNSQTNKYYGESTLVFDLLDKIVLPPMRTQCKTSSGRISNKSYNGLAELSIAVFHKNEKGKWTIVSNICPIRSRTSTKEAYWDFDESNVLYV